MASLIPMLGIQAFYGFITKFLPLIAKFWVYCIILSIIGEIWSFGVKCPSPRACLVIVIIILILDLRDLEKIPMNPF